MYKPGPPSLKWEIEDDVDHQRSKETSEEMLEVYRLVEDMYSATRAVESQPDGRTGDFSSTESNGFLNLYHESQEGEPILRFNMNRKGLFSKPNGNQKYLAMKYIQCDLSIAGVQVGILFDDNGVECIDPDSNIVEYERAIKILSILNHYISETPSELNGNQEIAFEDILEFAKGRSVEELSWEDFLKHRKTRALLGTAVTAAAVAASAASIGLGEAPPSPEEFSVNKVPINPHQEGPIFHQVDTREIVNKTEVELMRERLRELDLEEFIPVALVHFQLKEFLGSEEVAGENIFMNALVRVINREDSIEDVQVLRDGWRAEGDEDISRAEIDERVDEIRLTTEENDYITDKDDFRSRFRRASYIMPYFAFAAGDSIKLVTRGGLYQLSERGILEISSRDGFYETNFDVMLHEASHALDYDVDLVKRFTTKKLGIAFLEARYSLALKTLEEWQNLSEKELIEMGPVLAFPTTGFESEVNNEDPDALRKYATHFGMDFDKLSQEIGSEHDAVTYSVLIHRIMKRAKEISAQNEWSRSPEDQKFLNVYEDRRIANRVLRESMHRMVGTTTYSKHDTGIFRKYHRVLEIIRFKSFGRDLPENWSTLELYERMGISPPAEVNPASEIIDHLGESPTVVESLSEQGFPFDIVVADIVDAKTHQVPVVLDTLEGLYLLKLPAEENMGINGNLGFEGFEDPVSSEFPSEEVIDRYSFQIGGYGVKLTLMKNPFWRGPIGYMEINGREERIFTVRSMDHFYVHEETVDALMDPNAESEVDISLLNLLPEAERKYIVSRYQGTYGDSIALYRPPVWFEEPEVSATKKSTISQLILTHLEHNGFVKTDKLSLLVQNPLSPGFYTELPDQTIQRHDRDFLSVSPLEGYDDSELGDNLDKSKQYIVLRPKNSNLKYLLPLSNDQFESLNSIGFENIISNVRYEVYESGSRNSKVVVAVVFTSGEGDKRKVDLVLHPENEEVLVVRG